MVLGAGAINKAVFTPLPIEGVKMIGAYYRGEGPTRQKLRALLETIVYDASFLTEEVLEERFVASTEPEALELFTNRQGAPTRKRTSVPIWGGSRPRRSSCGGLDDRFGALDVGAPDDPPDAALADAYLLALRTLGAGRACRSVQPSGYRIFDRLRGATWRTARRAPDERLEGDFSKRPWRPYLEAALGFRNHWYPACFSPEVADGGFLAVALLGEPVLLKRIAGQVHAVEDRCAHRGVALSARTECFSANTVSCWYHGFTYDMRDGKLVAIITDPDSPLIGKLALKTYPVEERQNVVFVYIGGRSAAAAGRGRPARFSR